MKPHAFFASGLAREVPPARPGAVIKRGLTVDAGLAGQRRPGQTEGAARHQRREASHEHGGQDCLVGDRETTLCKRNR